MGSSASVPEKIYYAVKSNDIKGLQTLCGQEANSRLLNWTDKDGRNALMLAAYKGHYEAASVLVRAGVDVRILREAPHPHTGALHEAVQRGQEAMVELLLSAGASPFVANRGNLTAMDMAAVLGVLPVIRCLESRALFTGTVSVKAKNAVNIKVFKSRWAVIMPHFEYSSNMPRSLMWLYKDNTSTSPLTRVWLDGCEVTWREGGAVVGLRLHPNHVEPVNVVTEYRGGHMLFLMAADTTSTARNTLVELTSIADPNARAPPLLVPPPQTEAAGGATMSCLADMVADVASGAAAAVSAAGSNILGFVRSVNKSMSEQQQPTPQHLLEPLSRGRESLPTRPAAVSSAGPSEYAPPAAPLTAAGSSGQQLEAYPGESDAEYAQRLHFTLNPDADPSAGRTFSIPPESTYQQFEPSTKKDLFPPVKPSPYTPAPPINPSTVPSYQTRMPPQPSPRPIEMGDLIILDDAPGPSSMAGVSGGGGMPTFSPNNPFAPWVGAATSPAPGANTGVAAGGWDAAALNSAGGAAATSSRAPITYPAAPIPRIPPPPQVGPPPQARPLPPVVHRTTSAFENPLGPATTYSGSILPPPSTIQTSQGAAASTSSGSFLPPPSSPNNKDLKPSHSSKEGYFGTFSPLSASMQPSTSAGGSAPGPSTSSGSQQPTKGFGKGAACSSESRSTSACSPSTLPGPFGPTTKGKGASTSCLEGGSNLEATTAQQLPVSIASSQGASSSAGPSTQAKSKGLKGLFKLRGSGSTSAAAAASAASSPGSEDDSCVICLSARRTAGFMHGPSVHRCVCGGCASVLRIGDPCPMCRAPIEKVLLVF